MGFFKKVAKAVGNVVHDIGAQLANNTVNHITGHKATFKTNLYSKLNPINTAITGFGFKAATGMASKAASAETGGIVDESAFNSALNLLKNQPGYTPQVTTKISSGTAPVNSAIQALQAATKPKQSYTGLVIAGLLAAAGALFLIIKNK